MIVVYPFSLKDQDQAFRCAAWMLELEGERGLAIHQALIVVDHRVQRDTNLAIFATLEQVFGAGHVTGITVTTDAWDKWPESCNHMFAQAARHIERMPDKGPWLWLEADAIPLKQGWLDRIEAEYIKAGKPFMGDLVDVNEVPIHMSGVGIYPPNVGELAKYAIMAHEIAWDVQAADDIVPRMHDTKLIEHAWRHPTFPDWDSVVREVDLANAVLFHSSKDGSLIERLRERFSRVEESGRPHVAHNHEIAGSNPAPATSLSAVPVLVEPQGNHEQRASSDAQSAAIGNRGGEARESTKVPPAGVSGQDSRGGGQSIPSDSVLRKEPEGDSVMGRAPDVLSGGSVPAPGPDPRSQEVVCDIFIKTYPPDYDWLRYCFRSISQFTDGFRHVVVTYEGDSPSLDISAELKGYQRTLNVGTQPDGYLWQQAIKLDADKYTDAPFILYIDSDTIFTSPVTPKNYMRDGKIIWMMTPYEKTHTPWQPIVEKFLGKPVAFEFMRRAPQMVPRWLLSELRAFSERQWGMPTASYVMAQPHRSFSEFNALGAFAYRFFKDEFVWVNTEETPPGEWPKLTVLQHWSKGGLTPAIKENMETILSGSPVEREAPLDSGAPAQSTLDGTAAPDAKPQAVEKSSLAVGVASQPSILSVDDAIAVLAKEADRGWFYKKRLEKKLKEAGALPKWKRPRRLTDKKWKGK